MGSQIPTSQPVTSPSINTNTDHQTTMSFSQFSLLAALITVSVLADKPAVAPQYEPAAPVASASAPVYSAPAAPSTNTDSYGSPQAPVDAAPAGQQASPVTNQGYYYYYYPVRQGGAAAQESDDGLLGGLLGGGLLSAILGKKVIVVAIAIAALLVAIAFGLNLSVGGGRSFPSYSLLSEENLVLAADTLRRAMEMYGN